MPPLSGISTVESHVVEARDIRKVVLADRESKLRLVDLHPRSPEFIEQRQRAGNRIAPALVPQLHGHRIPAERAKELAEIIARLGRVLEARWKLSQERADSARGRKRVDARPKLVQVALRHLGEQIEQRPF